MRQSQGKKEEDQAVKPEGQVNMSVNQVSRPVVAGRLASPRSSYAGRVAKVVTTVFLVLCVVGVFVAVAWAESPAPGWQVVGHVSPTELHPGGEGIVWSSVFNTGAGSATGSALLVEKLPPTLEPISEMLPGPEQEATYESGGCMNAGQEVTCEFSAPGPVGPGVLPSEIEVPVRVRPGAHPEPGEKIEMTVEGAGALSVARTQVPVQIGSGIASVGFQGFDAWLSNENGTMDTQAGSHPYSLTVVYAVNDLGAGAGKETAAGGEPHDLNVDLPPGLVGEPGATPKCTREEFDGEECAQRAPGSEIGEDVAGISGTQGQISFSIYNLVPPPGVAAQFAFTFNGTSVFLDSGVRSGGDDGITTHVDPVPERKVVLNETTIWGMPGAVTGIATKPLLTLPTSCGKPPLWEIETLGTWQEEDALAHANDPLFKARATDVVHDNEGNPVGFTGCEKLVHFGPSLEAIPDTSRTDTPTGLTASVRVPQGLNPEGLATAGLKDTTVTLPEGIEINPGQATGLVACQPSQEALGLAENGEVNEAAPSCPAASKVGTDEIITPLLPDKLEGNVYVLQSNPPELKLLVAASADGVNLKLVGTVHLNETTGQLVTTFENTPDAPFTEFKLHFSGGAQAALVTPATCGAYHTSALFTPWPEGFVSGSSSASSFVIDEGTAGAPCPTTLGFSPTLTAGATTDQAGGFTGFSLLLQRPDDQQRVSRLSFTAPEGLLGMISKVPLCPEPQAAQGTCSAASQIGHTVVGAGPGPYPLFIPEAGQPPAPIYLTGGYKGAPYGLSIVVPIHAGPFTLQTQVVRAAIAVDPHTAQITVTTDPLPTIIDGIPADLRSIDAVIDREGFMFNPTNCNPTAFAGTATSTEGSTVPISSHFQVGSCQALTFKPDFKVSTSGKTSRADGASLEAKIVYPTTPLGANQASSQSNIALAKVDLPKQLPSRLATLQKACPAAQFEANPGGCPAASVVGHATVLTPVLPVPLTGPAYFVSHGGEAFPSLIVVLQGYGVTIDLVGTTFISSTGITTSTFKQVPDVPISLFDLTLPEGPYSALAANANLCAKPLVMPTEFTAQNGAQIKQSTPIEVAGCSKTISVGKRVSARTVTLSIYVPAKGEVKVSGKGLTSATKSVGRRNTITIKLHQKNAGKLATNATVTFTPAKGKRQSKAAMLKFRK